MCGVFVESHMDNPAGYQLTDSSYGVVWGMFEQRYLARLPQFEARIVFGEDGALKACVEQSAQ
jgi:hypothetical protein